MRTYINMRKIELALCLAAVSALCSHEASAQYRTGPAQADSLVQQTLSAADTASVPVVITLEQALQIALSENVSVKVADQEIQRSSYAKKGVYASLFPQIDLSGTYQRTIKKQVMYMDLDMGAVGGGSSDGDGAGSGEGFTMPDTSEGLEVGRWNTWAAGLNATMPLVNPQLWKNMKISGMEVEMAIEKARSSRLDMVTQVKQAYFGTLLAKEVFQVYRDVYENAVSNYRETEKKFKALSKGYQSIFKLTIALALNVPYVIFDEPVLGLDANHRELFYDLLLKEFQENERTLIIATHLIEEVANIIEEVVLIDNGRVLLQESTEELLETGYCVSGFAKDVDVYCRDKNVIGEDELGSLKLAYILGERTAVPQGSSLQITAMNLQKLFVKLTEKAVTGEAVTGKAVTGKGDMKL